jgi:polyphosphate glucokinase
VLNDADAAGVAEMTYGAGRERKGVVVMVTLGTGIGTALFIDGKLVPNTELGHIEIDGKDAETRASEIVREREGFSFRKWGKRLNRYFQTLEALLSPDLFIVGGGISKKSEKFFGFIHTRAELVPAQLLNEAGIVGAAAAAAAS